MCGQRWKVLLAILLIVGVITILVAMGYFAWYADELKVRPPDYCPTGTYPQVKEGIEVPGHTVILIDTSSEISRPDAKLAFQRIDA